MNKSLFLNELKDFSRNKLKKTKTEIYYLNGKTYIKNEGELDEVETLVSSTSNLNVTNDVTQMLLMSRQSGYVVDLKPDFSIDKIVNQLYLSGDDVAQNKSILKSNNITHIINVTINVPNKFDSEIIYMNVKINDLATESLKAYFSESFQFIEQAMNSSNNNNNVLVHCNQGVSRSASIIIAYLLQKRMFSNYKSAYNYVKEKRPKIMPNYGFVEQLIDLETLLNE